MMPSHIVIPIRLHAFAVSEPTAKEAASGVVAWFDLQVGPFWIFEVSLRGSDATGWGLHFARCETRGSSYACPVSVEAEKEILRQLKANLIEVGAWDRIASK